MVYNFTWKINRKQITSPKITGQELKPSHTNANDRETEYLDSKLDFPMVDFNGNTEIVSAAHEFQNKEGAKCNHHVSFL